MDESKHGYIPEHGSSKDFSFDQRNRIKEAESPNILSPARAPREAPTLLPVLDRHVLVTPVSGGSHSESIYALMRDWVQGPESLGIALANREKQLGRLHPQRCRRASNVSSTMPQKRSISPMNEQTEPTLESHLKRWKVLGKQRREEFQHRKALGFEKLGQRIQSIRNK